MLCSTRRSLSYGQTLRAGGFSSAEALRYPARARAHPCRLGCPKTRQPQLGHGWQPPQKKTATDGMRSAVCLTAPAFSLDYITGKLHNLAEKTKKHHCCVWAKARERGYFAERVALSLCTWPRAPVSTGRRSVQLANETFVASDHTVQMASYSPEGRLGRSRWLSHCCSVWQSRGRWLSGCRLESVPARSRWRAWWSQSRRRC